MYSSAAGTTIRITSTFSVEKNLLQWTAVRSSGPGGQNVNKVSTKAVLRYPASAVPEEVLERLTKRSPHLLKGDGMLLLESQRSRSLLQNQRDCLEKFVRLLQQASSSPRPRHATKATRSSIRRRLASKALHSRKKESRKYPPLE